MTEIATMSAATVDGSRVTVEVDLGAYVDVGSQTGLAVEEIDVIWQAGTATTTGAGGAVVGPNSFLANMLDSDGSLAYQLVDNNPNEAFVLANDRSLIGSGSISFNPATLVATEVADFYPDSFGKIDESRIVVADKLYFTMGNNGSDVNATFQLNAILRLKARLVKLDSKDWMAIAITSVSQE